MVRSVAECRRGMRGMMVFNLLQFHEIADARQDRLAHVTRGRATTTLCFSVVSIWDLLTCCRRSKFALFFSPPS